MPPRPQLLWNVDPSVSPGGMSSCHCEKWWSMTADSRQVSLNIPFFPRERSCQQSKICSGFWMGMGWEHLSIWRKHVLLCTCFHSHPSLVTGPFPCFSKETQGYSLFYKQYKSDKGFIFGIRLFSFYDWLGQSQFCRGRGTWQGAQWGYDGCSFVKER